MLGYAAMTSGVVQNGSFIVLAASAPIIVTSISGTAVFNADSYYNDGMSGQVFNAPIAGVVKLD